MRIHEEEAFARQCGQAPVEGRGIREDRLDVFFERNEDTGLFVLAGGSHERLQREHAFSRARATHDERRAIARQSAEADFVETLNACEGFQE